MRAYTPPQQAKDIIVAISGTIPAISHVALTVTDLSVSEAWHTRAERVAAAR